MQDAFNAQIKLEFFSANLYLQMAFWFRKEGWKGFANWMYSRTRRSASTLSTWLSLCSTVVVCLCSRH
jgi:ferritin